MLPPFIIEQIREREEKRKQAPQPVVELPEYPEPLPSESQDTEESERGVVIIDVMGD